MKICTKCKVERNDNEYYTYWHSTQQKYRTRNVCGVCTRKQSKDYKLKVKNIEPEVIVEQTKYCPHCKLDIPLSGYYTTNLANGKYCTSCMRKIQNQKNYEKTMSNGGSERIKKYPNEWVDEFQKAQTFMVLERLGWIFNEDTCIWSKEGVKTKDNVWLNIIPQEKKKKGPAPGTFPKKKHGVHSYVPEIIKQREEGMTYPEIADIYCCSHTTIRMIVTKYYNEKRNG